MAPASAKATADKTKAASKKASATKKRKEAPAGAAATGKAGSKKAIKKAAPMAVAQESQKGGPATSASASASAFASAEAAADKRATADKPKRAPKIRICLSAFDHVVLDEAAAKIIDTAERSGAVTHGPIPLPTHIRKFTVLRATFKFKDARDQFEMRTHRRLIDLTETTHKTVDALQNLSLPSGVDIEIKMMS